MFSSSYCTELACVFRTNLQNETIFSRPRQTCKLFALYQLIFAFATVHRYGNMIVALLYE